MCTIELGFSRFSPARCGQKESSSRALGWRLKAKVPDWRVACVSRNKMADGKGGVW